MALHRQGRRLRVVAAAVVAMAVVGGSLSAATPIHRWRAEGNANDSIGTNHGTLIDGATAAGAPAEGTASFSLDGTNDRVEMPDVTTHYFSGSFTIQAWVRSTVSTLQWVVTKYECGGASPVTCGNSFYRLGLDGNGAPFGDLRDSDGGGPDGSSNSQGVSAGTASIADGQFHHLRFVRDVDADLLAIYVDGALAGLEELHPGAAGALANDDGGADPLVVGAVYGALSNSLNTFFTGLIDDVQLFNEGAVALSDFAPTVTDTDPDSPADDNNPEIKGSAIAGSTVKLYTNPNCTGVPVATGTAANFASPGFTVSVPDDSTTTFFATATPATATGTAGTTTSACSTSSITYTEETTDVVDALQVIKGKNQIGGLSEIQHDDGAVLSLKSKRAGTKRVIKWEGRFTQLEASVGNFTLHYEGTTSRPVKRKVLVFNPATNKFECPAATPEGCVVAKGESTIDIAGSNLAQYRHGDDDGVRIRVQGKSRRGYIESTDVLAIDYTS